MRYKNDLFHLIDSLGKEPEDCDCGCGCEDNNLTNHCEERCQKRCECDPDPDCDCCRKKPPCCCICPCSSQGELVINGTMEEFRENIPLGWDSPDEARVSRVTQQGRVHSGASAVNLADRGILTQDVPITGRCYFNFSFFARGEGAQPMLLAEVTFTNSQGLSVQGIRIDVESQDLPNSNRSFGYYRGITALAPDNATNAHIKFTVTAPGGQSADIDDVSFGID